jgi:predicted phosphodiesterase
MTRFRIVRRYRAALGAACLLLVAGVAAVRPQIAAGPYLQNVTQTSITIMWETRRAVRSRVDYGATPAYGRHAAWAQPAMIHEFTITGLQPDTRYHYRVTSGGASTEDATFETAVRPETPFRFAVWGDSQANPAVFRRVARAIAAAQPRLAVSVGDLVDDGDDHAQWQSQFFDPGAALLRAAPYYSVMGNHEHNAHWYYDYASRPGPKNYYAFSYGNARFVVLDTNQDYQPDSPQYQWLVDELTSDAARGAEWRFVFFHQPPYCEDALNFAYEGEPGVRRWLVPLFEEHHVDVVFNGHTHDYERGFLRGVYYIITGGGGGSLHPWVRDVPHIALSRLAHHFCTVDVAGPTLTLRAVTPGGEVLDRLVVRKGPAARSRGAPTA